MTNELPITGDFKVDGHDVKNIRVINVMSEPLDRTSIYEKVTVTLQCVKCKQDITFAYVQRTY